VYEGRLQIDQKVTKCTRRADVAQRVLTTPPAPTVAGALGGLPTVIFGSTLLTVASFRINRPGSFAAVALG